MDPWLLTFLVILAYVALVILLGLTGILQRLNIQAAGPLLIWRTERGRGILERLARPRRLWGAFARVSVWLVFASMAGMLVLLALQAYVLTQRHDEPVDLAKVIGIPGINPLIPLGYGIVGLAIALLVHEGCHGVLARVEGIRVRSMGLLIAVIPIGAFVEPDESEMRVAPIKKRLRIYAVGPASNLVVAMLCAAIFSVGFAGSLEPIDDGAIVNRVVVDSPAFNASIPIYSLINEMQAQNGSSTKIRNITDFSTFMDATTPGETIILHYYYNGVLINRSVVLGARPNDPAVGYLGVGTTDSSFYITAARPQARIALLCAPASGIPAPGCAAVGLFAFLGLPVDSLSPAPPELQSLYRVTGPLAGLGGGFWVLADTFYWLFWLNFMLGTFNALPLLPLDGGHIFRDAVRGWLRKRGAPAKVGASSTDPEKAVAASPARPDDLFGDIRATADPLERRAQRITYYTSLAVLLLILWSFIAPRVVPALGG